MSLGGPLLPKGHEDGKEPSGGCAGHPQWVVLGPLLQSLEMDGSPCFARVVGDQGGAGPAGWGPTSPHGVCGPWKEFAWRMRREVPGKQRLALRWGLQGSASVWPGCSQALSLPGGWARASLSWHPGFPASSTPRVGELGATPVLVQFLDSTVSLPTPHPQWHRSSIRLRTTSLRQGFSLSHTAHVHTESHGCQGPHSTVRAAGLPGLGSGALLRGLEIEDLLAQP